MTEHGPTVLPRRQRGKFLTSWPTIYVCSTYQKDMPSYQSKLSINPSNQIPQRISKKHILAQIICRRWIHKSSCSSMARSPCCTRTCTYRGLFHSPLCTAPALDCQFQIYGRWLRSWYEENCSIPRNSRVVEINGWNAGEPCWGCWRKRQGNSLVGSEFIRRLTSDWLFLLTLFLIRQYQKCSGLMVGHNLGTIK